MRTKQILNTMAVFSAVLISGCAGTVSLADSEAGFQASSQSGGGMASSENQHTSESQNTRQAENQGGTGSMTAAHQENSSEGVDQAGRPGIAPGAANSQGRTVTPPTTPGTTSVSRPPTGPKTSAAVPREKTTTYNWGRRNHRARTTRTNRSYMVNTIHQAAKTK